MPDVDMSDMHSMVKSFPDLLTRVKIDQETQDICIRIGDEGLGGVSILGMGGSAIAGLYVQALLRDSAVIPILVNQEYSLPAYLDSRWATIAVSYSGNTEETLAAYANAEERNCQTFTIASGGKLSSKDNSLSRIEVPKGFQPRAAFPMLFSSVLNLVEYLMGLKPTNLDKIGKALSKKVAKWEASSLPPKVMAQDFAGSVPIFIGSEHLIPVAYRAKCQINENAKTMAFFSEIPEANHNEIESFIADNEFNILPVFLRSAYEDERIESRLDITTTLYEEEGYSPIRLSIGSSNRTEEMLALTLYLDLVSVELANIREVDPVSVDQISRLKKELD
ncbi:MAG: bifunctional phosphoglucose/phosphomannose isomerase [Candidatus Thorarchaeota archaeon]|jgi:glucose/mannose-6-phosphate isomerase